MCVPLPFFHSFAGVLGGISMTAMPFKLGIHENKLIVEISIYTIIIFKVIPGFKYDVKLIVEAIKKHECTHIMCTPTMVIDILDYLEKNKLELTSMRGVMIGGAPVPVEVTHRISRFIPNCDDIRIGYGATELGI
jgi:acyl-CoA synthetase (AMP-forming)/AMP-acid ligase II